MWKFLIALKKNLVWLVPSLMVAGIIFGSLVNPAFLQKVILPMTFLMVYPMMVTLQIDKVFSREHLGTQVTAQAINFLLVPLVAMGLGKLFFPDRPMALLGLLLMALLPTSGMTISWTGFAKGNVNAAIKMTVFGLIIGALAAPLYAKLFLGEVIDIPLFKIFKQITIIVFVPLVLGHLTQRGLIWRYGKAHYQRELKPKFPLFSTLGVVGIVFVAMALKAKSITSQPQLILLYLIPIILFYIVVFTLSTLIGRLFFPRAEAIALVYGTAMRNLAIALAIAMTAFGKAGSEVAIVIALAFVIQVQVAVWYVRLTDRLFGTVENPSKEIFGRKITHTKL